MNYALADSNVILDLFLDDPKWADWSESKLEEVSRDYEIVINPVIYSEISIGFHRIEELEKSLSGCGFKMVQIPKEALFLAGKAFMLYKKRKGIRRSPLPDFFIGAHAAVSKYLLITRDLRRYKSYFPTLNIIHP